MKRARAARSFACASVMLSCALAGCRSDLSDEKLIEMSRAAERAGPTALRAGHAGPGVALGAHGTARFATQVFAAFSTERALATAAFADRWYREPANDGFEAVIDALVEDLRAAGYGRDAGLTLEVLETPMSAPSWTPRSARLALVTAGGERVLHEFSSPEERDRTMLPRNAPAADVEGRLVTALDAVEPGCVLLVEARLSRELLRDAHERGAVLVVSSELADYNVDPRPGGERHLDAIGYRRAPPDAIVPVAQVSPRTAGVLHQAARGSRDARVRFRCDVSFAERPLRTVVATVVGSVRPAECVAIAAHVQEPGACDNASGVGTLLELARTTTVLIAAGELSVPARSLAFVFGDEIEQSRVFLEHLESQGRTCSAGIAADMIGESAEKTGAIALLERPPDPGALVAMPPDHHTAWHAGTGPTARPEQIVPSGIAVVARCALVDVGALQADWRTDEHPFEGGSDHTVFLGRGIPAVLFWHFPDFAYHTSLDRIEHVDAEEMRRTGSAMLTTALALADPRPTDLDRYLRSLQFECDARLQACASAGDDATAQAWLDWRRGARMWLRELCLESGPSVREPASETQEERP